MPRAKDIIAQADDAVILWQEFADETGIDERRIGEIAGNRLSCPS